MSLIADLNNDYLIQLGYLYVFSHLQFCKYGPYLVLNFFNQKSNFKIVKDFNFKISNGHFLNLRDLKMLKMAKTSNEKALKEDFFSFPKFLHFCASPDTDYVPSRPELHLVPACYLPILKLTFVLRDIQFQTSFPSFRVPACRDEEFDVDVPRGAL